MALRLVLMRHAKSAWPEGVADFDRPLAPRGREAAPLMAGWLARQGIRPDRVLVSSAARTRETWALVSPAFSALAAEATPAIYGASGPELLDLIREAAPDAATLMLVGHNPAMQELALELADPARSEAEAIGRLSEKYPTAGLAILDAAAGARDLAPGAMRLAAFITPRAFGGVDED